MVVPREWYEEALPLVPERATGNFPADGVFRLDGGYFGL